MPFKILSMVLATAMFVAYFAPIVVKLRDIALAGVVAAGVVFVLLDALKALSSD